MNSTSKIDNTQSERVCVRINAIRREYGNPGEKCPLCGGGVHNPHARTKPEGGIQEGCVDAFHVGLAAVIGNYGRWFHRQVAQELRLTELRNLTRNAAAS